MGLGIPNAICLSIKENGNFATAQLTTQLGINGVAVKNKGSFILSSLPALTDGTA